MNPNNLYTLSLDLYLTKTSPMKSNLFNSIILAFIAFMLQINSVSGIGVHVQLVFQHFIPDQVFIRGMDDNNWTFIPMQYVGENTFEIDKNLQAGPEYTFTICYTIPEHFGDQLLYITTKHGLQYVNLYMNNQHIGSQFLVDNLDPDYPGANLLFTVSPSGIVSPSLSGHRLLINDRIPNEVAFKHDTVFYQTAPQGFTQVNAWIVVLSDNNFLDSVVVDIDYIRLYARFGDYEELISTQEFNTYNPAYDGGLYIRYPFFPPGDNHIPMPATLLDQEMIRFYPSDQRRKVWHSWTYNWVPVAPEHTSYRMECRYRARGHAVLQGGIDYKSASNVWKEAGQGNWYFTTNWEWDTLRFDTYSPQVSQNDQKESGNLTIQCFGQDKGLYLLFDSKSEGDYSWHLSDMFGRKIYEHESHYIFKGRNQLNLNVKNLKSGYYILNINNFEETFTGKCFVP